MVYYVWGMRGMFIDLISIGERRLLLIKWEGGLRLYEWLSGAWEPTEEADVERMILVEGARVRGLVLPD